MRRLLAFYALLFVVQPAFASAQLGWSPQSLSAWINANPFGEPVILQKRFTAERNGFRAILTADFYKTSPPPTFSDNAAVAMQRQLTGGTFTISSGGKTIFSQSLLEFTRYWPYAVMPDVNHLFAANLTNASHPDFLIVLDDARGPHSRDFSVWMIAYSQASGRYRVMPGTDAFSYGGSVGFESYPPVMLIGGEATLPNGDVNAARVEYVLAHPSSPLARELVASFSKPPRGKFKPNSAINSAYFVDTGDRFTIARKYVEAEQAYRKALAVMSAQNEDQLSAQLGLARLFEAEGHTDEALGEYLSLFHRGIQTFAMDFRPYEILSRIVVLDLRKDDAAAALQAYNTVPKIPKLAQDAAYRYQYAHFGHNAAAARAAAKFVPFNDLGARVYAGLMAGRINLWESLHHPAEKKRYDAAATDDYGFALAHMNDLFIRGEESPQQADVYAELGSFFAQHGGAARGLKLLEGAAAIYKLLHLPVPPEILDSLAQVYAAQGRASDAQTQFLAAFAEIDRLFRYEVAEMGERDRLELAQAADRTFDDFAAFAIRSGRVARLSATLLERAARLKGSIAQSESDVQRKAAQSSDPAVKQLYGRLQELRQQIAGIRAVSGNASAAAAVSVLEQNANALDRQLTAKVGGADLDTAGWQQIRAALRPGDTLVQFVRSTHYLALVATRATEKPSVVDLGDAAAFDQAFQSNYSEYTERNHHDRMLSGPALYDLLWKPLAASIPAGSRVFVSADGILERVSTAIIPAPGGHLLADDYDLRFINTPLDIVRVSAASAPQDAVLLGDPQFAAGTFPPLPGTRTEVQDIYSILEGAHWNVPPPFLGANATVASVQAVRAPRVLHLATHGFFLPTQSGGGDAETALIANLQDPMTRSGLVFSGGNLMTAIEATNLDLHGTELVVLSACQSGLGLQGRGEGVFGLRRAFQEAGAQSMLVSMWSVPDRQTADLMQSFYTYWIADGMEKHAALRRAQDDERKKVIAEFGRDLPYYWGAFVLAGV
ncbi:MAG TPA: CHAT domain-containing protein [Candidatus Rubrimentiphilum sp.]|nr:CHAT domain-containing protein [Candidatus Rubrimentiphilum sp.]